MKQSELIVLGLAGLAVYMIVSKKGGLSAVLGDGLRNQAQTTSEIFNSSGTPFSNGWRYYSDGTAIDPQGRYYLNGQLVWSPAS